MRRLRLDLIGETAFFIAVGVVFGLAWWLIAGSSDMPYWVALLLIVATDLACRGVSALAGSIRARRSGPPPVPARHRKAGA